ncbi:MAG: response regulator transcription factor [Verrucomicrobiota bacterium]
MKQRILVVDDEAIIGETLKAYLEAQGFEISVLTDATGLVSILDSEFYELVILDLALADADGLEVLELLKEKHPKLPVLILTGMGYDDELMREAKRLRADGYMSKTVALPHLVAEVRRILRGASAAVKTAAGS